MLINQTQSPALNFAIITPTYNQSGFLMQAIESVQKTILTPYANINLQHIIWDDASSDDTEVKTKQKIEQIQSKKSFFPVKYYKANKNAGTSTSLNKAIETTSAFNNDDLWIMVLDHDDILLPRSVKNFADQILSNPATNWFTADFIQTDSELRYLNQYYGWQFENPTQMIKAILNNEHFCQQNICYKKSLWLEAGGYDPKIKIPLDIDLYLRFLFANHLPKYTSFINHLHRFHSQNASKDTDQQKHLQDLQDLYQKYQTKLKILNINLNFQKM
jgi:glycosyltransferase involved in cell wall biosynthesis